MSTLEDVEILLSPKVGIQCHIDAASRSGGTKS
jgi:hypothetical protein